jgi:GT2 family glycosyltransferase
MGLQRLRSALSAVAAPGRMGYRAFCSQVEPFLSGVPRVHRFAQLPLVGAEDSPAEPVAVCVFPSGNGTTELALDSLAAQSVGPVDVVVASPGVDPRTETRAPWLLVADGDDRLAPLAVERFGQAAALASDVTLLTCDEDDQGRLGRVNPRVRPGPSPDLLVESNIAGGMLGVRRDSVGHLPAGPAWRYALALTLAGPDSAGHAHIPLILRHAGRARRDGTAELEAARSVLTERDPGLRVDVVGGQRRVRRAIRGEPSVEAIVLFRNGADLLKRCAGSILDGTTYGNFRLRLVDNGSDEREVAELLARLRGDSRVQTMRDDRPFNFAALNNTAAAAGDADFLLFLNNDTELISPTWIEELLEHAQRPEVGAVAPMLLYGDGTVQHAGAAIGLHGYGGHPFAGLTADSRTPFGSAGDGTRNWLAVTAACMLVERRKFELVGSFDESFVVAGNDVDLCLRLTAAGFRSLCVTHVRHLHHEGRSRGTYIDPGDYARSEQSYGAFRTVGDPFYNPNLTLARTDCGLRRRDEL